LPQKPKFNGLKNRKNLRTVGFNFYSYFLQEKRSIYTTLRLKKRVQANLVFKINNYGLFSTKNFFEIFNEQLLIAKIFQMVKNCKIKNSNYINLITVLGSLTTVQLAYFIVKKNFRICLTKVDKKNFNKISSRDLKKLSIKILTGKFKFLIHKQRKYFLSPLSFINFRQKVVQKIIVLILTIFFEILFLGFKNKPFQSRYFTLKSLQFKIKNVSFSWLIRGNIKKCFNNTLVNTTIIKELLFKINCFATRSLIEYMFKENYASFNNFSKIKSSNVRISDFEKSNFKSIFLSPIFNYVALRELDKFIRNTQIKYYYSHKSNKIILAQVKRKQSFKKRLKITSNFFLYQRYQHDFIILINCSFKNVKVILEKMFYQLRLFGLILSVEKTKLFVFKKGGFNFLDVNFFFLKDKMGFNCLKSKIILRAPVLDILFKLKDMGFVKQNHKGAFLPISQTNRCVFNYLQIFNYYHNKTLKLLNYYRFVTNTKELILIVQLLNYSCVLTLAKKYKIKALTKLFKKVGNNF
jgi:hypothetical protein